MDNQSRRGNISDEQALKDFLMDIDCLDQLSPWAGKLNIFDVLKITRTEIRNSNMLAWLLDPNESHGLRDSFLRGITQLLVGSMDDGTLDVFKVLMMDFESFTIRREWNNIDLLVVSEAEKVLLCIENKIDSGEHSDQLNRYQKIVRQAFPDYIKIHAYLTPDGVDSSIPDVWQSISYRDLMELLDACIERTNLPQETKTLISHYMEAVRRDIVGDERLKKICNEIYSKHRQALDLIFDNRPDVAYYASEIIKKWCDKKAAEGVMFFDRSFSNNTFIRFTTPLLSEILPDHDEPASAWRSRSLYFYEINNRSKVSIKLVLSSKDLTEKQRLVSGRLISILKPNDNKPNWQWKTLFASTSYEMPDPTEDTYDADVFKKLDALWGQIQRFERDLMVKWNG